MNAHEPPVRHGFDVTGLPIEQTASVLRTLAREILEAVLTDAAAPPLMAALTLRPGKIHRASKTGARTVYDHVKLARLRFSRRKRYFFGSVQPKSAYLQTLERYDALVQQASNGKMSPGLRRHLMAEELAGHLQGAPTHFLPEDFWRLAGEIAWQELQFQFDVRRKIIRFLRRRVLFNIGELPRVSLSPRTFWALLVLARPPKRRFGKGKKLAGAMALLTREGRRQIAAGGWATFWDQWLICEYLRRFPGAIVGHDALFEASIRTLPLVAEAGIELPLVGNWHLSNHQSGRMAAASWRQEMPSWMPSWYGSLAGEKEPESEPRTLLARFLGLFRRPRKNPG